MHAELAPEAGFFGSAEWRQIAIAACAAVRVYADHAGLERLCHAHGAADVARPDRGIEAIRAVVGQPHDFGFGVKRNHHHHRAENLFLGHAHGVVGAGQDGGGVIGALGQARRPRATGEHRATLGHAGLDIGVHRIPLRLRHQRADLGGRIKRVADLDRQGRGAKRGGEFLRHAALDKHAGTRRATLARIAKAGLHRLRRRLADIGIGEHDVRALAAQFQGDALDVVGTQFEERGAGRGLAGE